MDASFIDNIMPKILLMLKPFVLMFDKIFTIPFSVKLISADHYFIWKPRIKKGTIFITDTWGQGSNLLNPSKGKHGAIYVGKGLKTKLIKVVNSYGEYAESMLGKHFLSYYRDHIAEISDEIEYVIEALGKGVQLTSVIKFLSTKDVVFGAEPKFCDVAGMEKAAENSIFDLGLPYDFEFHGRDNAKYCFEVLADAYLEDNTHIQEFTQGDYFGYRVYTAATFKDSKHWLTVIDSKEEFPDLYKK